MAEIRSIYGSIKLKDEASGAINSLKHSMEGFKEGLHNVNNVMGALGAAYIVDKIREFGMEMIHAAAEEETQAVRLKQLAGEGYDVLKESIEGAVKASHGLADETDLNKAANSALKFGASIDFVKDNISAIQQLSATMGMDVSETFQGMQNAINTGSIRFLRQSPILVQHIAEFKRIGQGYDEATKKRRELFMTQIFSAEQAKIAKDYAETLETTNGLLAKVRTQWEKMKEVIGGVLSVAFKPLLKIFGNLMEWLTTSERGIAILKTIVIALSIVIGTVLLASIYVVKTAVWELVVALWSTGIPELVLIIAGAVTALILIIDDLYVWMKGGTSVIGKWLGPFDVGIKKIKNMILSFKITLVDAFNSVIKFFKSIPNNIKEGWDSAINWVMSKLTDFAKWIKSLPGIKQISEWMSKTQSAVAESGTAPGIEGLAGGGKVRSGRSYLVGEQGPELFSPGQDGNISPNGSFEKGFTIGNLIGTLTINVSGGKEAGQAVEMAVMDALNHLSRTVLRSEMGMATT